MLDEELVAALDEVPPETRRWAELNDWLCRAVDVGAALARQVDEAVFALILLEIRLPALEIRRGYDTTAWKRLSANNYKFIRKRAGKIVQTSTNEVSNDGKTMDHYDKRASTQKGQLVHNVTVYDKQ